MSNTNRCKDCRYWNQSGDEYEYYDYDDPEDFSEKKLSHRICLKIVHVHKPKDREEVQAFTVDASGYGSRLWTAPDFGCALWEAK